MCSRHQPSLPCSQIASLPPLTPPLLRSRWTPRRGARTPDERARASRLTACVLVQAIAAGVSLWYVGPVQMPITSPYARNPSCCAWRRELSGSAREGAECRRGLMVSRGMEVLTAVGDVMVSMVLGTVPLAAPNARIRPRGHDL